MSELKAYNGDVYIPVYGSIADAQVYLKSDADKVIAEKDKEISELKEQLQEEHSAKVDYKISAHDLSDGLREAVSEIHHHRYKRCMEMAKWCKAEADAAFLRYNCNIGRYAEVEFYEKWHKRWLELADKVKGI